MMGFMALLLGVGVAIKLSIAIVPMYWDNRLLQQVISTMHESRSVNSASTIKQVRAVFQDRIRSNNLNIPLHNLEVKRGRNKLTVSLNYEVRGHLVANLFAVGQFSVHEEFE